MVTLNAGRGTKETVPGCGDVQSESIESYSTRARPALAHSEATVT